MIVKGRMEQVSRRMVLRDTVTTTLPIAKVYFGSKQVVQELRQYEELVRLVLFASSVTVATTFPLASKI